MSLRHSLTVKANLPTGILYEIGSISEVTKLNIQESDVSDRQTHVFSCSNIASGDSIQFTISFLAKVASVAFQQSGNANRL
jgi:hypothetical protein